jgi:hypothetical protein
LVHNSFQRRYNENGKLDIGGQEGRVHWESGFEKEEWARIKSAMNLVDSEHSFFRANLSSISICSTLIVLCLILLFFWKKNKPRMLKASRDWKKAMKK